MSLKEKLEAKYTATGTKVNLLRDYGLTQRDVIPTRGNTIADALFSKDELKNAIDHKIKALGPQRGSMVLYDEVGNPLTNHRYYHHELKKWVTSDHEGRVTWGNQSIVDEAYRAHKERDAQIDYYADRCCVNNEICAYTLGFKDVAELESVLGTGKGFKVNGLDLDADLVGINAMPEMMELYPNGKEKALLAIKKMRLLVGTRLNRINLLDVGGKRSDENNVNVQEEGNAHAFAIDGTIK